MVYCLFLLMSFILSQGIEKNSSTEKGRSRMIERSQKAILANRVETEPQRFIQVIAGQQ
jgi:hypothetical protein